MVYGRSDVSNLQVGLLARVRRVEGLIIREAVQILVVLIKHLEVILAIGISFEVVKEAEEHLERHKRI